VAVIGAGPSGLVVVNELLEQGHRPVCFERAGSKGGVFRFGEQDGVVWESCKLTSSGLITAQIGCKPRRQDLRRQNRSFRLRFYAGPFVAAQYRLVGPNNAKPAQARQTIERLPIAHPLPQLAYLYLRWLLCRILNRLPGPEYAPKLVLE